MLKKIVSQQLHNKKQKTPKLITKKQKKTHIKIKDRKPSSGEWSVEIMRFFFPSGSKEKDERHYLSATKSAEGGSQGQKTSQKNRS